MDRLLSQMYFFSQSLKRNLEQEGANHELRIYSTFLRDPKNVSGDALHDLLDKMRELELPVHHPNPYELVLSRSKFAGFKPSKKGLRRALASMDRDLQAVGTTETLPTLFVLLSKLFNRNVTSFVPAVHPDGWEPDSSENGLPYDPAGDMDVVVNWTAFNLTEACHLHLKHGLHDAFPVLRRFGIPSADRVLNSQALAVLQAEMRNEMKLWRAAGRLHDKQLQSIGLTRQSAVDLWDKTCKGLGPVTTQSQLKRYRLHTLQGVPRRMKHLEKIVDGYYQRQRRKKLMLRQRPIDGDVRPPAQNQVPRSVSQKRQHLHYHGGESTVL